MTDEPRYPVHWRDPYNGDTERLARDAAAHARENRAAKRVTDGYPLTKDELADTERLVSKVRAERDATGSRVVGIPVGTVVECWPGARPEGRSYQAVTTSGLTSIGGHTPGYYVRSDEGVDFIAKTHIRVVL